MLRKLYTTNIPNKTNKTSLTPVHIIVFSFILIIISGTLLLKLPFSTVDGDISILDALFTATSATCVTGLVVYDTFTKFTFFGQLVIISMIQIGGLGLVTFTIFFSLIIGKHLGLGSLKIAGESANTSNFLQMKLLIKNIMKITFAFELTGAILFMIVFIPQFGAEGIWISIFTSISAFCNAGFDIFGRLTEYTSLTTFANNFYVLTITSILIISGGLGFIVWTDIFNYKRTKKLLLHSKIVLIITVGLIILGGTVLSIIEWNNPNTLGNLSFIDKISNAFFQSISARTAGFNSIDLTQMSEVGKLMMSILMFIGAAPGSTGGGIKITTFAILIFTVISVIKGKDETVILGRQINKKNVYRSHTIVTLAIIVVFITSMVLLCDTPHQFTTMDYLFETISAFGTVGLSVGVVALMGNIAKIMFVLTMFIGRVGPITFALFLAGKNANTKKEILPDGDISIG